MKPWESFLEKYTDFGHQPTKDKYVALFDPDATLLHPGMAAPIGIDRIPEFITLALDRLPDFQMIPAHWAANSDTIFVEARNIATARGERIVWPATYVITLRGDRVLRGRAYYDRAEALFHFEPGIGGALPNAHTVMLESAPRPADDPAVGAGADAVESEFVLPYVENWRHPEPSQFARFYAPDARMINPGFARPLRRDELAGYYAELLAASPGLRLHLESWAAAPSLLFVEWTATGEMAGKPFKLGVTDRFTLRDTLATEGVAYFDELGLRALVEPDLARFADLSLSGSTRLLSE